MLDINFGPLLYGDVLVICFVFGFCCCFVCFCRRNLADGLDKGGSYAAYYKGTCKLSNVSEEKSLPFRTHALLGKLKTMPTEFKNASHL